MNNDTGKHCSKCFPIFFLPNQQMKRIITAVLLVLTITNTLSAITAYPELVNFRQPDKKTFVKLYLKGDEKVHWAESVDGYSLVVDENGYFVYATKDEAGNMVATQFIATDIEARSEEVRLFLENTPKHLFFSKMQTNTMISMWNVKEKMMEKSATPLVGNKKILVILMQFPDKQFHFIRPLFSELINQVNCTTRGAKGSVHDFYYENSYGQLNLTADVVGIYTTRHNASHYGSNSDQTTGYQDFAREAVMAASSSVDFSDYDNDGDGVVDCVHILFAGQGEEAGGGADCIWSHKWTLFNPLTYNNTRIVNYSCSPELAGGQDTRITAIGVICHEIGHVFGAPDYYDTDYGESGGEFSGTGKWDIMANGSWNQGGGRPAHHNPYTKCYIYGWTSPKTLSGSGLHTLKHSGFDSSAIYRLNTSSNGDYYLLENRQMAGFDRGLPGHGLIAYHVHPRFSPNQSINTGHPQKFYVVPANMMSQLPNSLPSSYGSANDNSCPFPGSTLTQTLNDETSPSLRSWDNNRSRNSLTYIGENLYDSTIVFFFNSNSIPEAEKFEADPISDSKIKLTWNPFGSQKVLIVRNDTNVFSTPQMRRYFAGDTLPEGEVVISSYRFYGNSLFDTGLEGNKTYYYKIYCLLSDTTFSNGITCSGTTLCNDTELPYSENFSNVTSPMPDCWTTDNSGMGCEVVTILQQEKVLSLTRNDTSSHTGSRISKAITMPIDIPVDSCLALSFYTYREASTSSDTLYVMYHNQNGGWNILEEYTNISTGWSQHKTVLKNTTPNYRIAFELHRGNGSGMTAIDSIEIIKAHVLNVSAGREGTITPSGNVMVADGADIDFQITVNAHYELQSILIDSVAQPLQYQFGITNVTAPHTVQVTFARSVSIDEADRQMPSIKIFPNPAHDKIHVSLHDTDVPSQYAIYDMSGRIIGKGTLIPESTSEIPVGSYPTGLYYISFGNSGYQKTEKIIIQR